MANVKLKYGYLYDFKSRKEAVNYFKSKYGNDFMFKNTFMFDEDKEEVHVYLFLINRDEYYAFLNGKIDVDFSETNQNIMIWKDGKVLIGSTHKD